MGKTKEIKVNREKKNEVLKDAIVESGGVEIFELGPIHSDENQQKLNEYLSYLTSGKISSTHLHTFI